MFLEEKLAYLKAKYETCNLKLKMTPKFLNNRLYDEIYNLSIDIREKEKEIEGLKWRIREEKINEILNEK
jgi:hypothetical protein